MGQPDTVNQLLNLAQLLNPKFDAVEKLLPFWVKMPTNEVKAVTNLF